MGCQSALALIWRHGLIPQLLVIVPRSLMAVGKARALKVPQLSCDVGDCLKVVLGQLPTYSTKVFLQMAHPIYIARDSGRKVAASRAIFLSGHMPTVMTTEIISSMCSGRITVPRPGWLVKGKALCS